MTEPVATPAAPQPSVHVRGAGRGAFAETLDDGRHTLLADEPVAAGGDDLGPGPYELLLMALGACTAMTLRMYARRKQWPLTDVRVTLRHSRDYARDCAECDKKPVLLDRIEREIEIDGTLDDAQSAKLLEIADKCPVHRTLSQPVAIRTTLRRALG
jgi:putative redox protein